MILLFIRPVFIDVKYHFITILSVRRDSPKIIALISTNILLRHAYTYIRISFSLIRRRRRKVIKKNTEEQAFNLKTRAVGHYSRAK